ncbi:peptidoglycan-binding domain-containing protein [Streptodolium elevatio]|uniref:Peptidoglycan-binding protein n=1 Tax=Streptodolium elevatio TaxID=3157996 RepID=A0ABV3DY05_9ACTN
MLEHAQRSGSERREAVAARPRRSLAVGVVALIGTLMALMLTVPAHAGGIYLSEGSSGRTVTCAQQGLNNWKAQSGKGKYVSVDGKFGPATKAQVKVFQANNGLKSDGIVGAATAKSLQRWVKGLSCKTLLVPDATNGGTPTLRVGSQGPAVRCVQRALNAWAGKTVLTVDGAFGSQTRAQVVKFQKHARIAQDGVVGRETILQLKYRVKFSVECENYLMV